MREALKFGAIFSVYEKDASNTLFEALYTLIHAQTQKLDDIVCVCEGEVSHELLRVLAFYPEIRVVHIPRQIGAPLGFGLPFALNRALREVHADIVLKVDTDDLNHPERVAFTKAAFQEFPLLDIHGGQITEWNSTFERAIGDRSVPLICEQIVRLGKWKNPFNGPTVAFRKDFAERVGGFPEVGANEDYALWGAMLQHGARASNSDECYVHMRGGVSLVGRRMGPRYRLGERQALNFLHSIGFLTTFQWLVHVISKEVIRRIPRWGNMYIYAAMRTKPNRPSFLPHSLKDAQNAYQNFCQNT